MDSKFSAKHLVDRIKANYSANEQFEAAKLLAANCGYQLVAEDTDLQRIHKIKDLINDYKRLDGFIEMKGESKSLIIEGLEGLLK